MWSRNLFSSRSLSLLVFFFFCCVCFFSLIRFGSLSIECTLRIIHLQVSNSSWHIFHLVGTTHTMNWDLENRGGMLDCYRLHHIFYQCSDDFIFFSFHMQRFSCVSFLLAFFPHFFFEKTKLPTFFVVQIDHWVFSIHLFSSFNFFLLLFSLLRFTKTSKFAGCVLNLKKI